MVVASRSFCCFLVLVISHSACSLFKSGTDKSSSEESSRSSKPVEAEPAESAPDEEALDDDEAAEKKAKQKASKKRAEKLSPEQRKSLEKAIEELGIIAPMGSLGKGEEGEGHGLLEDSQ